MELISRKQAKQNGLKWYFTGVPCKRGHVSIRKVSNCGCTQCIIERNHIWQKQYRDAHLEEFNKKARVASKRTRTNNPVGTMLWSAKRRAKANGLEFNITQNDIQIPTHCPVLGIPLIIGRSKAQDNSPSIDRIDNSKGYIKGNVCIVSWRINQRKSDMSTSEILALAEYVTRELH